ncbi:MAG: SPOR domain-containing protein [Prevotellaceae bacterium]|jgi:cell division protein FtsN|nr:SPOR domain-containing protein [Prevotellaceae bacterium]
MKKLVFLGMGLCITFAFSSCKSSESAYKKAYEKAKQQELVEPQTTAPAAAAVQTPVVETPAPQPRVVEQTVAATPAVAPVRQERVEVVSGADNLKDWSVVCGSFGVKANAEGLKDRMAKEGYAAVVVFAPETDKGPMYRVIVSSFADKYAASQACHAFKTKYANNKEFQGAWLLNRIK